MRDTNEEGDASKKFEPLIHPSEQIMKIEAFLIEDLSSLYAMKDCITKLENLRVKTLALTKEITKLKKKADEI